MRVNREDLKKRASKAKPLLRIGKSGLTKGVLEELDRQLEEKNIVKIKFLRSSNALKREEMTSRLTKETRSELVETRGNTITLFRAEKDARKDI